MFHLQTQDLLSVRPGDWEPIGHVAPLKRIELNPKWPERPEPTLADKLGRLNEIIRGEKIWRLVQEAAGASPPSRPAEPEPPNLADHHADAFFLATDHVFWVSSPQHVEWSVVGDWADWQLAPLGGLPAADPPPARSNPPNVPAAVSGPPGADLANQGWTEVMRANAKTYQAYIANQTASHAVQRQTVYQAAFDILHKPAPGAVFNSAGMVQSWAKTELGGF